MTNNAKASRRANDEESNNPKGRSVSGKSVTSSGSGAKDTPAGLRRSTRETQSSKNSNLSPPSTRKSERLEKLNPSTPVTRKSSRLEKQPVPSPLRRSSRCNKQSPPSRSSGSKKSGKSPGTLIIETKPKKEKRITEWTSMEENSKSREKVEKTESKRMRAASYRQLFKPQKDITGAGDPKELSKNQSQIVAGGNEFNQKKVKDAVEQCNKIHLEEAPEEHDSHGSEPEKEVEDMSNASDSSHSDQKNRLIEDHDYEQDAAKNSKSDDYLESSSPEAVSKSVDDVAERAKEDHHYEHDAIKNSKSDDYSVLSSPVEVSKSLNDVAETVIEDHQYGHDATKNSNNDVLVLSAPEAVSKFVDDAAETVKESSKDETGSATIKSKRKRNSPENDSHDRIVASSKEICISTADVVVSSNNIGIGQEYLVTCGDSLKRQRPNNHVNQEDICCSTVGQDSSNTLLAKDSGENEDRRITGLPYTQSNMDLLPAECKNRCSICGVDGKLLCCSGKGCGRGYHLSCLDPPLEFDPPGSWHCHVCVRKKIELGIYSVSEVESVWDVQEIEVSDGNGLHKQKQFFVKYKGLAHVHNRWLPESELLLEAPSLVASFNQKDQVNVWEEIWKVPHRLLQKRFLKSSKHDHKHQSKHVGDLEHYCEWLVKWRGLDYAHSTWELEDPSFLELPAIRRLIQDYENRQQRAKKDKKCETEKSSSVKLAHLSAGDNNHLEFVNILREYWHNGQNAVIVNDQERRMKVISFIFSLLSDVSCPFLVVTTPPELFLWDNALCHLAPFSNVVVYHGSNEVRRSIRTLELYGEHGCIIFQILITSPHEIIEDLDVFKSIKWEAVIVDECQHTMINSHFEQIKFLSADMRLLLVNSELKEDMVESLHSLLDCESNPNVSSGMAPNSRHTIGNFMEWLSKYIVTDGELGSSRFLEYWVPARLSSVQIEQYCATLLSHSPLLVSSSKNDQVGAFSNILISTRKCCDHPYIMDPSLQPSLLRGHELDETLEIGIKASGKLQLLDVMLSEIRKKCLRVLILFQSGVGSGKDNIGDILDDFVRQRFGQDSYERVDGNVNPTRKQTALQNFNNQKRRFAFLLETQACLPSIKLSPVDIVIIFGSDWNPINDLRNLQKITLDSQFKQIQIFRLYSVHTVEEKALILAKQGKFTANFQIRANTDTLLRWGAEHLFEDLTELHNGSAAASISGPMSENFITEVIRDFLNILPENGKKNNGNNSSMMLKVKQNQGRYSSNIPLVGELKNQLMDEEPPHIYWKKMLEGKHPRWKYLSVSSQRNRKRVQYFNDPSKEPENESAEVSKKRKKVAGNGNNLSSLTPLAEQDITAGAGGVPGDHASCCPPKVKLNEQVNLRDSQNNLHLLLKPQISTLCRILQFPEPVRNLAEGFLEYVMNNHHVSREPMTILQAFQMSLCWAAASWAKHKFEHEESLQLAKQHLDFDCKKEEVDYIYSMLRCLKRVFMHHARNLRATFFLEASESSMEDLERVNFSANPSSPSIPSNKQKSNADEDILQKSNANKGILVPGEEFDEQVLSQFGLAHADFSKSIVDIKKVSVKELSKLSKSQQEEQEKLKRKYEEDRTQLDIKKRAEAAVIRRLHNNSSMRTEKLRFLDVEYEKKFEELNRQQEMDLKILEAKQQAEKNILLEKKVNWLQGVKNWAQGELIKKPPLDDSSCSPETLVSLSPCLQEKNPDQARSIAESPLEGSGTITSNDGLVDAQPSTSKQVTHGILSSMAGRQAPLGVSVNAHASNFVDNEVSSSATSSDGLTSGEEVPVLLTDEQLHDRMTLIALDGEFPSVVPEIIISSYDDTGVDHQERMVSDQEPHTSINSASSSQENGVVPSGSPVTAPEAAKGGIIGLEQDEEIQTNTAAGQTSLSSAKTALVSQQNEEVSSSVSGAAVDKDVEGNSNLQINNLAVANINEVVQIGYVVCVTNQDNHLEELPSPNASPIQPTFQDDSPLLTASARLHDKVDPPSASRCVVEQSQTSVPCPENAVAPDQFDNGAPLAEPVMQLLPAADSSSFDIIDLPNDIAQQPRHESNTADNISEGRTNNSTNPSPIQSAGNHFELSNHGTMQPVQNSEQSTPAEIPASGLQAIASTVVTQANPAGISNHPLQTVPSLRMPLPLSHDPLQFELDRMLKEAEEVVKAHENDKLQLQSDCEKEIEEVVSQIRRKYNFKLMEIESQFHQKKKELDANHNRVLKSKILAEAVRSKCMDIRASKAQSTQSDRSSSTMPQLQQRLSHTTLQRPPAFTGQSHASCPVIAPPLTDSPATASVHIHQHNSVFTVNRSGSPHVTPSELVLANIQVNREIQAPAPNLQSLRPPMFTPMQLHINSPTTTFSNLQSRHTPPPHQSVPLNRAPQTESASSQPSLPRPPLISVEAFRNVHNQSRNQNPITQQSVPQDTNQLGLANSVQASPTPAQPQPGEVVCLSDDED